MAGTEKGERKVSSSARCIFHRPNENWSTWRNKLVSLLPRCGIENKAQNGTKSDQSDGTPALLAKPRVCAKHRGEQSRWHPLHSHKANWACKCQMATAAWYERAPPLTFRTGPSRPQSLTARSVLDLSSRKGNSPYPTTPKVMSFMTIVNSIYTIFSYCYRHVDF